MLRSRIETDCNLSVAIPEYRSSECLPELLRQLCRELDSTGRSYEVILVDDGSRNGTLEVVRGPVTRHRCLRAVQLMGNRGQEMATIFARFVAHRRTSYENASKPGMANKPPDRTNKGSQASTNRHCFHRNAHESPLPAGYAVHPVGSVWEDGNSKNPSC